MTQTSRNRRLRVLVLNQHYWPEIAATAQLLSDVCEDIASSGCEVTVVCSQPSYRSADRRILPARETHRGVHIRRVWSHIPARRGIPQRLASYGSYFVSSLLETLSRQRPDVCLVLSTPPLLLGLSGMLLRALRGVPFVYSVQDLYPDVAIHLGVLRAGGPLTRSVGLTTDMCYRGAAALVTLSSGMAERLVARGVCRELVQVIPNWADTRAIAPQPRDNPFARQHGLSSRFVIQYSGNLGLSQGLEATIAAAAMVQDLPITFLLVGDGNARTALQGDVRARGLSNVRFLAPQPRHNLSELLGSCDVGLVTMKKSVANDLVPSKLYGIMAAARPVLAAVEPTSEVGRVVSSSPIGWVVNPEDPKAIARAAREAYTMPREHLRTLGQNGRAVCVSEYSREALTEKYRTLLVRVAEEHAAECAGSSARPLQPQDGLA